MVEDADLRAAGNDREGRSRMSELRHFRVSVRPGGSTAYYVSDEHAESVIEAVAAALRRRSELQTDQLYQFTVQDVDRERAK